MKTSLNLDDHLFKLAKEEAAKGKKTISEVISLWANYGHKYYSQKKSAKTSFTPVSLGKAQVDLSNRKSWMEELE